MSFRTEEKLRVDSSRLPIFLAWLNETGASMLYPSRQVSSIYLDNDRLSMYHDSEEGVLPRKKLRLRKYDAITALAHSFTFETKISSVEGRFKTSVPAVEPASLAAFSFVDNQYGICRPRITVSYLRSYYVVKGIRLTLDRDLSYQAISMAGPSFHVLDSSIVIEVKGPHNLSPDHLAESIPWDRARFSKYCRAVESTLLSQH